MQKEINSALAQVDQHESYEFDLAVAASLRGIVGQLEHVAVRLGFPKVVQSCQVGGEFLTPAAARLVVSKCIALLPKRETMAIQFTEPTTVESQSGGAMSRDDAAKYLGVSTRLLDNLLTSGTLQRLKIGRKTVVSRNDLEKYLTELATS